MVYLASLLCLSICIWIVMAGRRDLVFGHELSSCADTRVCVLEKMEMVV
ncbi:unnamed protein product [Brassica oleracea var. botrytis]